LKLFLFVDLKTQWADSLAVSISSAFKLAFDFEPPTATPSEGGVAVGQASELVRL
jgi:hypothetical protein